MARRLYLGNLSSKTNQDDVTSYFEQFGKVVEVRVMSEKHFGFVEFDTSRSAEEAVRELNGKEFMGTSIVVEYAKEGRRRNDYDAPERSHAPRRRPAGYRLMVDGISRDTSWQDLKDFGREAGNVSFADIDRDVPGRGILEYLSRSDAEFAAKDLDGRDLRGQPVTVTFAEDRGPDNFRRDDRDRYRGDRYDRDRYSDRDRFRDERPRRGRSSSPPRREDRARSPPPPREFDEKRRDDAYERRRDDRKRDDRDRFEERPNRHQNSHSKGS
ncbi:RNA-binding domain-containing [Pyrrhoderma noxium]|uniref:RNA-binding domain-containing n=1 Tax=Pyrrhoderma noxium TaxID=2282107 RepID=A0A286UW28_9AGAM|nr:RNA-binding domain-containing [Pyrrhoderma noxium]